MSKDLETIIKIQEKIIKANDTEIKEYKKISDWLMDKTVDRGCGEGIASNQQRMD